MSNRSDLIESLNRYIEENRHSLPGEDIEMLESIICELKDSDGTQVDYQALLESLAKICNLAIQIFEN